MADMSPTNGKFNYDAKKKKFYEKKENRCATANPITEPLATFVFYSIDLKAKGKYIKWYY